MKELLSLPPNVQIASQSTIDALIKLKVLVCNNDGEIKVNDEYNREEYK